VTPPRRSPLPYNQCVPSPTLSEDKRDSVDVVLVSPRNPLNIGAAARAMANFGLSRLTVVAPYAPMWREARSAVGAPELLLDAKESATLAEAVAHSTLVLGTGTLNSRKPGLPVVSLPDLPPLVAGLIDRLAALIEETMQAAGYSPRGMQAANRHDLRLILRRLQLSPHDTRRSLGLFRRILWRLRRSPQPRIPSK